VVLPGQQGSGKAEVGPAEMWEGMILYRLKVQFYSIKLYFMLSFHWRTCMSEAASGGRALGI